MNKIIKEQIDDIIMFRHLYKDNWKCFVACKKILYTNEINGSINAKDYTKYIKYIQHRLAI